MATGIVGGTFDPIHVAHLIMAEYALDALGLDRVVFVPAPRPPHKRGAEMAPIADRVEMVRLAIDGNPRLSLSEIELERPGESYTIETVREMKRAFGCEERLYFIMGADSLAQFRTWKDPEDLLRECSFAVVPRPGVSLEAADPSVRERVTVLDMPLLGVASSDIRERVRTGRSIRYLVPPAVESHIRAKKLYS